MTPQELDAWIARHGGADQDTRSMAGQRIVITKDGSRVVLTQLTPDSLRVDDLFEKDAPAPAPEAPATPSAPAPATSTAPTTSRGGAMAISKADLEAKAGGNPNLVYQGQKVVDKTISEYGVQKTIRVPVVTWIDRRTGYTLSAEVEPGGESYTVVQDGIDERNKDDNQSGTKEGDVRPAPASSPIREVYRGGKWVTEPNPLYQAPEAPKPAVVATNTTEPYIVINDGKGNLTTKPNPNYQGPKPERGTTVSIKGGDGRTYLVPIDAQGNPGKAVDSGVPGEGTGPQGPALPTLVLGQVQAGLRGYKDQLNREVAAGRMTPAVADKRWKEATELGGFAIQEAQTFQRDEESRRNADVNLRTNAMSNAQSGFNSALDFVTKLNATLPEGSTAGGAAFEAILGLQQLHARRMGAYDNQFSGPDAPRSQEARGIDAATQAGVGAVSSNIGNVLNKPPEVVAPGAPAVRPPYGGPTTPSSPNAVGAGAIGNQPAPGPVAPVTPAPPISGQARDTDYRRTPDGPYQTMPETPSTPPAVMDPIPVAPNEPPLQPNDPRVQPLNEAPPEIVDPYQASSPQLPPMTPTVRDQVVNGPIIDPYNPGDPGEYDPALQSKAMPGNEFAALAQFNQQPAPAAPRPGAPDAGPDMVAMRRAQIASVPPWKLSDQDIEWAMQNGFEEDAWRVPGRRIA